MRTLIAVLAVLLGGAVMAQAYRWVDEDGVVHFSDVPTEGAERIELPRDNRPRSPAPAPRRPVQSSTAAASAESAAETPAVVFKYESIEVVQPAPEETLWNIEGVLNVALRVTPALRSEDTVRVIFDGEQRMTTNSSSFQVQEVWRGVHNIQVEIVDSTGRLMARSLPNRFYVQQNAIGGLHMPVPAPTVAANLR
jgi:hypothetical protein